MANEYEIEINGQPTRYSTKMRKFKMYFAEPEGRHDAYTGILLLIAGYGGNAGSKVYQKMRRQFADDYNLVTLQCDYLGYQYMQNNHHLEMTEDMLRHVLTPREFHALRRDYAANRGVMSGKVFSGEITLGETAEDFNEMGLWQAMDNLMAVKLLIDIMKENGLDYCPDRVYIYGQSHGAYLAYLCNFLAPGLFAGIIENSAYLFPYFWQHDREVTKEGELFTLHKVYHYWLADREIDRESYDLRYLYNSFENEAQIIVYHGEDDEMIPLQEKQEFLAEIKNVSLHVVTKEMVDGIKFCSTGHSLGADFLLIFEEAVGELETAIRRGNRGKELLEGSGRGREGIDGEITGRICHDISFQTERCRYEVRWGSGIPVLKWN